jgi:hypothetical protein
MRRIDHEAAARSQAQRERERESRCGAAQVSRGRGENEGKARARKTEVGTSVGRVAARRIFICYGHRMGSDFRVLL